METTKSPLGVSNGCTNASEDPRVVREISKGLLTEKGMANIENVIALMNTPEIGDPQSIRMAKENVMRWDRNVPIGGQVTINCNSKGEERSEWRDCSSHSPYA